MASAFAEQAISKASRNRRGFKGSPQIFARATIILSYSSCHLKTYTSFDLVSCWFEQPTHGTTIEWPANWAWESGVPAHSKTTRCVRNTSPLKSEECLWLCFRWTCRVLK